MWRQHCTSISGDIEVKSRALVPRSLKRTLLLKARKVHELLLSPLNFPSRCHERQHRAGVTVKRLLYQAWKTWPFRLDVHVFVTYSPHLVVNI